ncbi:phospholipase ABHD3-like [Anneissia japonica]|uniref:phospholipase ABHD3-like n=1 Tax=Anneissia japonica TaxID=1529436 RepID=UPI00142572EF|nr:phospholipase ABHD3-like [Anneissia japonica]
MKNDRSKNRKCAKVIAWSCLPLTILAGAAYAVYYKFRVVKKPGIYTSPQFQQFLLSHCSSLNKEYRPTAWCVGGRLQTIARVLFQSRPQQPYRVELIPTPDGGELSLHWVDNQTRGNKYKAESRPTVIILPGLTGYSRCGYVLHMVDSVVKLGYRAVVFHNRGLGGAQLKTPQTFSAAYTDDFNIAVKHIKQYLPRAPLMAAGTSLGGMILFNYLAKHGDQTQLNAAFTVSTPWNVFESTKNIERPINRWLLNSHLARNLRKGVKDHITMFEKHYDPEISQALKANTIREFDSKFTTKVFGYEDVNQYYEDACLHTKVQDVKIPTVCLNAGDDPISPMHALPINSTIKQENVALVVTHYGGHLGFLNSFWPRGKTLWHTIFSEVVDAFFKVELRRER